MTTTHFHASPTRSGQVWHEPTMKGLGRAVEAVLATIREWRRRAHDRRLLASLDDRMLRDIGITRTDAVYLSNKPFWRE